MSHKMNKSFLCPQLHPETWMVIQLVLFPHLCCPTPFERGNHTGLTFVEVKEKSSFEEDLVHVLQ